MIIKKIKYYKTIFNLFLTLLSIALFLLFLEHSKTIRNDISDLPTHIDLATEGTGYSFLHELVMFIAKLLSFINISNSSVSTFLMILVLVVSIIAPVVIIRNYFRNRYKETNPYFIDFLSLSLMLVSMIIINPFSPPFYLGIGTPNPWHNPTYMFSKPFSLIVFIYFLKSFDNFKANKTYIKELLVVSLFAILSMWAKPSFLISFLPAVALLMIYKQLKRQISIKFLILVGLSLSISLLPLYIINNFIYNSPEAVNQIIFAPGVVWSAYTKSIPLAILLSMAFPLFVYLVNINRPPTYFNLAFLNYIIAIFIFFFLAESGDRIYHGNFGWVVMFAIFFMFFISSESFFLKKNNSRINIIGSALFSIHLISGIYYLIYIALGNSYY